MIYFQDQSFSENAYAKTQGWNDLRKIVVQSFKQLRPEEEEEITNAALIDCTFCDKSYRHSNILRTRLKKSIQIQKLKRLIIFLLGQAESISEMITKKFCRVK